MSVSAVLVHKCVFNNFKANPQEYYAISKEAYLWVSFGKEK